MKPTIYQLKVTLRYTKPPIWRRLEVRGDIKLGRLHRILQVAMGWADCHLHQFIVRGRYFGPPNLELGLENENRIRLDQVLQKPKDKMIYEYDFGDSWEHNVVLEKVLPFTQGERRYPVVTGGKRACPPEDCGGVGGFYTMLEVLQDPDHPEHEEYSEWLGEYDQDDFDVAYINRSFHE